MGGCFLKSYSDRQLKIEANLNQGILNMSLNYKELLLNKKPHTHVLYRNKRKGSLLGYMPFENKELSGYSLQLNIVETTYLEEKHKAAKKMKKIREEINEIIDSDYLFAAHYNEVLKIFGELSIEMQQCIAKKLHSMFNERGNPFKSFPPSNDDVLLKRKRAIDKVKSTRTIRRSSSEDTQKELMKKALIESDQFYRGYDPSREFARPSNEYFAGTGSNIYRSKNK